MRMPFGKHQGRDVKDIPRDYLVWATKHIDLNGPLKTAIEEALEGTEKSTDDKYEDEIYNLKKEVKLLRQALESSEKLLKLAQQDAKLNAELYADNKQKKADSMASPTMKMLKDWLRDMAKVWHPDKQGGSTEGMKAVNMGYEKMKSLIGGQK